MLMSKREKNVVLNSFSDEFGNNSIDEKNVEWQIFHIPKTIPTAPIHTLWQQNYRNF